MKARSGSLSKSKWIQISLKLSIRANPSHIVMKLLNKFGTNSANFCESRKIVVKLCRFLPYFRKGTIITICSRCEGAVAALF